MSYDQQIHNVQQNINSLLHQLNAMSVMQGPQMHPGHMQQGVEMQHPMSPNGYALPGMHPAHVGMYGPMPGMGMPESPALAGHQHHLAHLPMSHMAVGAQMMGHGSPPPCHVVSPHSVQASSSRRVPHSALKTPRAPLGELPMNSESPTDPLKALVERERVQRLNIQRLEITESARLEMNVQNLNIKKNSQRAAEASGSPMAHTPKHAEGESLCPKTCEREENADGSIKYDFSTGLPGGACVYFMKGYCGIGNRCRYVHDSTDPGAIVKITGMPYSCTVQNIIEFFAPLDLQEKDVTYIMSKEGKQSGSAFVEFASRKDALLALGKDRNFINAHRFVLLYPSSKVEREWFLKNPMPFSAHATPSQKKRPEHAASPKTVTPAAPGSASPVTPQSVRATVPPSQLQALQSQSPLLNQLNVAAATSALQQGAHAPAEEHKTPTPVKQLSFDEQEDTPSKRHELLNELSRKLSNPTVLRGMSEENLRVVLGSIGYPCEKITSVTQEIKGGRNGAATGRSGLPPLVPMMAPSKMA
eukprot:TRINITY_DN33525_c0_g1_i1.p1 TRINITY_DN33525_c0_g1~~TRINITY_DN33525_c0_g1_i1.p1  ORF type:complete len:530 (+),score=211.31 TRINITY_DN33525_c0_g1_i1:226-1815(+)